MLIFSRVKWIGVQTKKDLVDGKKRGILELVLRAGVLTVQFAEGIAVDDFILI